MSLYQKIGNPGKKPKPDEDVDKELPPEELEENTENLDTQASLPHLSYEEMEAKLNETETKLEDYKTQLLRNHADLENIRKRAEKDISNAHKYGIERLVTQLLPVIDSLERGLSIEVGDNEFARSLHEGLEMTYQLFLNTLGKVSVKPINPLDQPFNPELHQAISTQDNSEVAPNTVVQVLQKGYQLQDRLIRPALVIVSK